MQKYLKRHGNKFKYSRRVPKRFEDYFNNKFIIRSINTTDEYDAGYHAKKLNVEIDKVFSDIDKKLQHVDRNAIININITINDEVTTLTQDNDKAPKLNLQTHIPGFKKIPKPDPYNPLGLIFNTGIRMPDKTSIQELINEYKKYSNSRNLWREETTKENERMFILLTDFLPAKMLLHEFNQQTARDVRDFIHKLPKNRNKKIAYRELSVKKISRMSIPKKDVISDRTKDKYIGCYIALFNHAVLDETYETTTNPFLRLRIGAENYSDSSSYAPFNDNELFMIFNSENSIYTIGNYSASRFFVPLLILTGMGRVQEYTQLNKQDIKKVRDIWCIDHNTDGDKKLKTGNSKRLMPIHSKILNDCGFLEYVDSLKDNAPLFPELSWAGRGNYAALSSWFNNTYLPKLQIKAPRKVLYSFKATASTLLDNKDTPELTMAQIAGHKYGSAEIVKTYSAGKSIVVLQSAIESIDFECLNNIRKYTNSTGS